MKSTKITDETRIDLNWEKIKENIKAAASNALDTRTVHTNDNKTNKTP